jgi:hypothetical protein
MSKPTIDHFARINAIRRILLDEWDPIGIGSIEEAHDDYDNYVTTLYRMMQERAGLEKVVLHLGKLEKITMRLNSRPDENGRVAKLLVAIMESTRAQRATDRGITRESARANSNRTGSAASRLCL